MGISWTCDIYNSKMQTASSMAHWSNRDLMSPGCSPFAREGGAILCLCVWCGRRHATKIQTECRMDRDSLPRCDTSKSYTDHAQTWDAALFSDTTPAQKRSFWRTCTNGSVTTYHFMGQKHFLSVLPMPAGRHGMLTRSHDSLEGQVQDLPINYIGWSNPDYDTRRYG